MDLDKSICPTAGYVSNSVDPDQADPMDQPYLGLHYLFSRSLLLFRVDMVALRFKLKNDLRSCAEVSKLSVIYGM